MSISVAHVRTARSRRPPATLLLPAGLVAGAMLLPLTYLVIRALGAGADTWDLLLRPRTLQILARSLLLVVSVTGASIVIAVPLAWLTVRTDLPLRRVWAVLTVLPLVIPSYVAGFLVVVALGPGGWSRASWSPWEWTGSRRSSAFRAPC